MQCRANRIGAVYAVILGENEVARGTAQLKDLASGAQTEMALDQLASHIRGTR